MTALDLLLLVPVAVAAFRGYRRGLVSALIQLAGAGFAFYLAATNSVRLGTLLSSSLPLTQSLAPVVGFALIFTGIWVVASLVARLVTHSLEALSLSGANRIGGAVFSAMMALVVVSASLTLLARWNVPSEDLRNTSALYEPVKNFAPKAFDALTAAFPASRKLYDEFNHAIGNAGVWEFSLPDWTQFFRKVISGNTPQSCNAPSLKECEALTPQGCERFTPRGGEPFTPQGRWVQAGA